MVPTLCPHLRYLLYLLEAAELLTELTYDCLPCIPELMMIAVICILVTCNERPPGNLMIVVAFATYDKPCCKVENHVQSHPNVVQAMAFAAPHPVLQECVGIAIVVKGERPTLAELRVTTYP